MMKNLFILVVLINSITLFAQDEMISLKSGYVNYTSDYQEGELLLSDYYLMTFDNIPNNNIKSILNGIGVEFLEYIPSRTFVVRVSNNVSYINLVKYGVVSVLNIIPEFKIDPKLQEDIFPSWTIKNNFLFINVLFYNDLDSISIIKSFSSIDNIQVHDVNYLGNSLLLSIHPDNLYNLASIKEIWYVEPIDPPSFPENKTAITLHRSNIINSNFSTGKHYNGEGVNVMMQDDGLVGPHIDRQGRVDQSFCNGCSSSSSNDHGDHVSGTIMGAGNLDPLGKGMADGSFLYVYGSSNNNYNDVPSLYLNNDVVITSKSYSNGCNAGYTSLAKDLDEQINLHPSLIHVFSAGNDGNSDCGYGAGSGWGNVTGGHKQGKNVIATANLTETSGLAGSSSRGPAADGRIKPDIGAKGTDVYSPVSPYTYDSYTGTSMACPGISGVMAQLYHAYKDLNSNQNPSSALMKCILLNSANDIGNPGPDFKNGWGEVNAFRALSILEENSYFSNSISQGIINTHDINVPIGVKEMNIMVYWHDKEASANASTALVNDINISLNDGSGTSYLPWVLDPTPNPSSLDQSATNGIDNLNNMEQITIENPNPGTYTLVADGFSIPFGPQEYWVTYQFIKEDITLTYPIGGEGLVPGEMELIRWEAPDGNVPFSLEYTVDNGLTWNVISNSVSVSANYYNWQVPNNVTNEAKIRISRNNIFDESDANFTIVKVPNNISVNWICPDSIYIDWNNVNGATEYEVSMLGSKYMDSMTTTTSPGVWIINPNPMNLDSWFSVCSKVNNGKGRRAIAVNAQPLNSGCVAPPVASFSILNSPSCSGDISFIDQSLNQPNTWYWDFGDGNTSNVQNPSHTYLHEGIYDVMLFVSNSLGQDSLLQLSTVVIDFPSAPTGNNDTAYIIPSTFLLTTVSNNVNWYLDTLGSNPIFTGSSFQTSLLSSNTTFYLREVGGPSIYGGPLDNTIGGGGLYNNDRHLFIDCYVACKLISVDVYAGTNHSITFELRDNNSQVIQDTSIVVQVGLNTLYLDFDLPVMNNLELGISAGNANLYRNNSGASYPYNIGNLASITGHNSPWGDPEYHYFFYNLQLQENCLSEYGEATAIFIIPSDIYEINDNIKIYPNPTNKFILIDSDLLIDKIIIYDSRGRICVNKDISANTNKIDCSSFSKGIYTIDIIQDNKTTTKRFIIK